MTSDERNQIYEVLMMINASLKLIVNRAETLQKTCQNIKSCYADIKGVGLKYSREILEMAKSIEKRKKPIFKMIKAQGGPAPEFRPDEIRGQ